MKLIKPEMQDLNAEVDKIFADAQTQNIDFGRLSAGLSSLQSEAGDTALSTTQVEEKLKELEQFDEVVTFRNFIEESSRRGITRI